MHTKFQASRLNNKKKSTWTKSIPLSSVFIDIVYAAIIVDEVFIIYIIINILH